MTQKLFDVILNKENKKFNQTLKLNKMNIHLKEYFIFMEKVVSCQ